MRLPSSKRLEYYAAHFETVELNYTFYRMPNRKTSEGMIKRTPPGFRFFVKGHRDFTHNGCLDDAGYFLEGIRPFVHASRLDGLLFQFPQSFKNTRSNRDYLHRLVDRFNIHHLAIEFRDCSWDKPWVYRYMEDHRLSIVSVDEPNISTLFPKVPVATNDIGYVRLHSSNGEKWYSGTERYDYNYNDVELKEWAELLGVIGKRSRNIFVYFNNCHRGQAAQNANEMKRVIRESGLALKCAEVDRSVNTIRGGLFETS